MNIQTIEQKVRQVLGKYIHTDYAHSVPFGQIEKDLIEVLSAEVKEDEN